MALKATDVLELERVDGVAMLTLNRPAQRNALSRELMRELLSALEGIGRDPEVRAVVIAGRRARSFSAGHDLGEMVGRSERGLPRAVRAVLAGDAAAPRGCRSR